MNQHESYFECAVREIQEEININISNYIKEDQFIRMETIKDKHVNLYLINELENLVPKLINRNEIHQTHWFPINNYF